jgi:hypothetical protein
VSTGNTARKSQLIIIIMPPHPYAKPSPRGGARGVADPELDVVREPVEPVEGLAEAGAFGRANAADLASLADCIKHNADSPLAFVLSSNLHRRHLTETKRAKIGARIAQLRHGRAEKKKEANLPLFLTIASPIVLCQLASAPTERRPANSCPRRDRPNGGGDHARKWVRIYHLFPARRRSKVEFDL